MPRNIVYRSIVLDTVSLQFPATRFMQDRNIDMESATTRNEAQLVDLIISQQSLRYPLLEELKRSPRAFVERRVVAPFITDPMQKPGDIDVLVCDQPNEAAAIETKRVKLTIVSPEMNQVNRIDELAGGVAQANRLHELGFYQTFFAVITIIDARSQVHFNVPNRGIDPATSHNYGSEKTFRRLIEFPGRDELNREIGILFLEVVQTTNASLKEQMIFRIAIDQPAARREQRTRVTNLMEEYIRINQARTL